MNSALLFDDKASERLLAVYVTPDVVAQRRQIIAALRLQSGEKILDVGSGPGFLAAAMADLVGPQGAVQGIDISEPMRAIAAAHCADRPSVRFHAASATSLPFGDGAFDVATVTQVMEYVADVGAALGELARVLRPGGRMLILDTDWDSIVWHTTNRPRMIRILEAWDEHLADPYLPRTLASRLSAAGFEVTAQTVLPIFNPRFEEATYSNRMIDLIAAFVVGRRGITAEEAGAWAAELRQLGGDQRYFFSLNRYLFMATKPAAPKP